MITLDNKAVREINRAISYIHGIVDTDDGLSEESHRQCVEALMQIYSILDTAED